MEHTERAWRLVHFIVYRLSEIPYKYVFKNRNRKDLIIQALFSLSLLGRFIVEGVDLHLIKAGAHATTDLT